jgi:Transposase DDE domain
MGFNEELPAEGRWHPPDGGRNGEQDFRGEKRSNETHESTTDPDARLYRKGNGQESRLCYIGEAFMENRNGLAVGGDVTHAGGTAERDMALNWVDRRDTKRRITLGGDKAYDVEEFVEALRDRAVTPHITVDGHVTKTGKVRKTAIDKRTTRHPGYAISQCIRKRIEEIFGWTKTTGGLAQLKVRGLAKAKAVFIFALAAYDLIRLPKLLALPP